MELRLHILQILIVIFLPVVFIKLEKKWRVVRVFSPIVFCYLGGMLLANQKLLPINRELSLKLVMLSVVLSIPLLLFSLDFRAWLRLAKMTLLSCLFAFLSATLVSCMAGILFNQHLADSWRIAGMLLGALTGGTGNLAAIGTALQAPAESIVMLTVADVTVCGFYFFFLISGGSRVYGFILRPFVSHAKPGADRLRSLTNRQSGNPIIHIAKGLGLSLTLAACAYFIGRLFPEDSRNIVVILVITALAIGASFHPYIRTMPLTYQIGEYLLLIFAVSTGSMLQIGVLPQTGGGVVPYVIPYVITVLAGTLTLHVALAAFFRIDRDTMIITSVASIFSPAFVGPIASHLRNKEIVISGITSGLVGFAVGNYLGIVVGYGLKWLLT